ncbi:MAG: urease accessory protein UreD [Methylophilaceae bacterium]
MDDDRAGLIAAAGGPALNKPLIKRWEARLNLDFKSLNGRSYLAKNLHFGPLVLQKTLYPESDAVCHGVVIHPPGGVAGGDELTLNINVNKGAHALLTTPGAGKWYKANGLFAKQQLQFEVGENAYLEWLPQENILFDGSKVSFSGKVTLAKKAKFAAWEVLCLGRQAQQERWQAGELKQNLHIFREGKLIWNECASIHPSHLALKSIVGTHGRVVSASFVVAAGAVPVDVLDACRAIKPQHELDENARYGVTALPEIFAARYVGQSTQCAKAYFEMLWQCLRPWYANREMLRPRIWNT